MICCCRTASRVESERSVEDLVRYDLDPGGVVERFLQFRDVLKVIREVRKEEERRTCHPSTHIAPKLSKLTVPSPSLNTTPLLILGTLCSCIDTVLSINTRLCSGRSNGGRGVVAFARLGSSETGFVSGEEEAVKSTWGTSSCS